MNERRSRHPDRISAAIALIDENLRHQRVVDRLFARNLARHEPEFVFVFLDWQNGRLHVDAFAAILRCFRPRSGLRASTRRPSLHPHFSVAVENRATHPCAARAASSTSPFTRTYVGRFVVEKKFSGRTPSAGAGTNVASGALSGLCQNRVACDGDDASLKMRRSLYSSATGSRSSVTRRFAGNRESLHEIPRYARQLSRLRRLQQHVPSPSVLDSLDRTRCRADDRHLVDVLARRAARESSRAGARLPRQ